VTITLSSFFEGIANKKVGFHMRTLILYSSKSGNTKKIADSMASQIGCDAIRITSDNTPSMDLERYDLVFVGTGLFFGTPNEDIVRYLGNLNMKTTKMFALFITWGGAPRSDKLALTRLKTLLESKGQKVLEDHFACYGGWKGILMKRGHPKPEEIKAAGEWAKELVDGLEKSF
jgi:flavodoxin